MTNARLIARNTLFIGAGQAVPMIAAVLAIPILISHLGAPRFGVLTLAWAAIGYFGLFDLGLGRALTQAVAVHLGKRAPAEDLGIVAWTALALMLGVAVAGGVVLAGLAPWIVRHGLNIPLALQQESLGVFHLLALSLPFVVTTAGLRGLLEAHQEFGIATALRIPLALFTFVGPLVVLPFSSGLIPIVAVLVAGRVVTWLAHAAVCLRRYDYLRIPVHFRRDAARRLLRFGGWMTMSNVVSPIMSYLDRFFIGAILPLAAVAYYVTPYELVTRLLVIPQAMVVALFPAFAATFEDDRTRTSLLFERATRIVLAVMFPVLLAIVLYSREGLTLWVGPEMAGQSTPVLQWLAIGVFLNSMAQAPFVILQSTGRPDVTAKLHLAELPIYLASLWGLTHQFGVVGVAMAWSLRAAVDAVALLILASRRLPGTTRQTGMALVALVLVPVALGTAVLVQEPAAKAWYLAAGVTLFGLLGWTLVLPRGERDRLKAWAGASRRSPAAKR